MRQHPTVANNTRRTRMPDMQSIRKKNLRALIKQWDGPTNLAKKLQYSGPSYLSQLIGQHKPVTEKTARFIEKTLDLPTGWMDNERSANGTQPARLDTSLVNRVMLAVAAGLEDAGLRCSPKRMADLVSLVYDHAVLHGQVDDELVGRIIQLMKEE